MKQIIASPNWIQVETKHSASGQVASSSNLNMEIYQARHEFNARLAEALSLTQSADALQKVRTYLVRGKLNEAETCLMHYLHAASTTDENYTEFVLEIARLTAFKRKWEVCRQWCLKGLEHSETAGISRLYFMQVLSVALYELGEFAKALSTLESMESLVVLYPFATAGDYAKVLKARIEARILGAEHGTGRLNAIWQSNIARGDISFDQLLTLLRAEVDIKRIAGQSFLQEAQGCYLLATLMGEELYKGYALIDIQDALSIQPSQFIEYYSDQTREAIVNFKKEIIDQISTTGKSFVNHPVSGLIDPKLEDLFGYLDSVKHILFVDRGIIVNFLQKTIESAIVPTKQARALKALGSDCVDKCLFFKKVWGDQKYSSDLHDNGIRVMLSQLRKSFNLDLTIENKQIKLKGTLIV